MDAVKTCGQTLKDAEIGHRTTSLRQLAYIAIQTGKKLYWDAQQERFANNDLANRLLRRPMSSMWNLYEL
ncbi:MAG: hypothetical protein AB1656_27560 [Candidatus Omnitrophota bacterium]